MGQFRVTGPDGVAYNVTAPDGASASDVMAMVQRQHQAEHDKIAAQIATDPISQGARNFNSATGDFENAVAGYGKAGVDLARGAGQLMGLVSRNDVAESRKLDSSLMNTKAGMAGNILGNVVDLAPAAFIPGAATIPGGLAVGAGMGLLQPSTSTRETMLNTGLGGLAGGAVPVAQRAWQIGKAAAEPLYQAGQERIVGRTLNAAAGRDAPAVAQRLAEAGAPFVGPSQGIARTTMGEYVPGSLPTVGQAAENAGVASLERAATAGNPAVTNAIAERMAAQNAARTGSLSEMAGQGGMRDFFAANRDATAQQLYGAARRQGIDPKSLSPEVLQNIASFSKRVPDEVIAKAQQLAKISGEPMTDATSVQGLHWVKMAIDDLIGAADRAGNSTLKRAYTGLQKDLLTGMDNMSPAYANARQTFAAMSRPLNQMDVAKTIADRSISPLTGNLQPAAYARALSDKTAAQATGFAGATLENTMAPTQLNALNSILQDVQRSTAAQNAGRGAGSDTVQKLAYTNLMDQSGVPTFIQNMRPLQVAGNLAARGGDAVYGRANKEIAGLLGDVMLDPGKAALLMAKATPAQRSQILGLLGMTVQGGLLSAPASANALQQ